MNIDKVIRAFVSLISHSHTSMNINKVVLIGNLGADPDVKSFEDGGKICNIRIATTESYKDKSGIETSKTEWHTVSIKSEGLIEVATKYLKKGSKVYIEGQLRTRKWKDKTGTEHYSTEVSVGGYDGKIIMLDKANQPEDKSK
jgi:single-strand DNA-binding protein